MGWVEAQAHCTYARGSGPEIKLKTQTQTQTQTLLALNWAQVRPPLSYANIRDFFLQISASLPFSL